MGNVLEIVRPLKHGYILRQIILVGTPKGPEKITQTGLNPLHRVAMHFAYAIAIIVARLLVPEMADGSTRPSRGCHFVVSR